MFLALCVLFEGMKRILVVSNNTAATQSGGKKDSEEEMGNQPEGNG